MVGKTQPASAGFLLPTSLWAFLRLAVSGLFPASLQGTGGGVTMQLRKVAMRPRKKACSKCSGFLARNWNVLI